MMRLKFLGRVASSLCLAGALLLLSSADTISSANSFDLHLSTVAGQQRFDMVGWLAGALAEKLQGRFDGGVSGLSESERSWIIERYFTLAREEDDLRQSLLQRRASLAVAEELQTLEEQLTRKRADKQGLEHQVEAIVAERLERAAQAEGLAEYLPLNPRLVFPPVAFKFVSPPLLMVISPRDRIEQKKTIHLLSYLPLSQIEAAEAAADKLGVSSLIVPVGGVATYPTMVLETSSYEVTLDIVGHEWIHNYLDLRPLGWHYRDSGSMTSINETVANIAGHELSRRARALPPPEYADELEQPHPREPSAPGEFDFNREMRVTRLQVDALLAEGHVQEAEAYMEQRRRTFVERGHPLRKLNQAYFAFYGSYADGGVGSVNPIGGELKRLRRATGTLKDFLDAISSISSFDEYRTLLKATGVPEGKR